MIDIPGTPSTPGTEATSGDRTRTVTVPLYTAVVDDHGALRCDEHSLRAPMTPQDCADNFRRETRLLLGDVFSERPRVRTNRTGNRRTQDENRHGDHQCHPCSRQTTDDPRRSLSDLSAEELTSITEQAIETLAAALAVLDYRRDHPNLHEALWLTRQAHSTEDRSDDLNLILRAASRAHRARQTETNPAAHHAASREAGHGQ